MTGDFNLRLDDSQRKTSKAPRTFLETYGLKDTFMHLYPYSALNKEYIFPPKVNSDPSRLDYIFVSNKIISQPYNIKTNHFF